MKLLKVSKLYEKRLRDKTYGELLITSSVTKEAKLNPGDHVAIYAADGVIVAIKVNDNIAALNAEEILKHAEKARDAANPAEKAQESEA